jgi:6-phosphofructokinase 2
MVVGLSRGLPVPEAARYAVAAGTAAVMTPGTQLCRRADVERLCREIDAASPRPATE